MSFILGWLSLDSRKTLTMKILVILLITTSLFLHATISADDTGTVKTFVKAFNERDVQTMLTLVAPDMKWMSITGQTIATETATAAELEKSMSDYFKSLPSTQSKIRSIHQSGNFVYALEEATWTSNDVVKSQCSVAIYEFTDSKIHHVWYFPAHTCS